MEIELAYRAALMAQIVSLEARRSAAKGYVYNTDLQLETRLLDAQVEALKAELNSIRS